MSKNNLISEVIISAIEDFVGKNNGKIAISIAIGELLEKIEKDPTELAKLKDKILLVKSKIKYVKKWKKTAASHWD